MPVKEIRPIDMKDNVFRLVGQDWLLVSAAKDGKTNGMTASWGGFGVLWARPVAFIFIRPTRYTKEFVDAQPHITLSVFDPSMKPMMNYFGTVSGRDEDKIAKSGLTLTERDGYTYFDEARLSIFAKKLYAQLLAEKYFTELSDNAAPKEDPRVYYPEHDYHTMYVAEIEKVLIKE